MLGPAESVLCLPVLLLALATRLVCMQMLQGHGSFQAMLAIDAPKPFPYNHSPLRLTLLWPSSSASFREARAQSQQISFFTVLVGCDLNANSLSPCSFHWQLSVQQGNFAAPRKHSKQEITTTAGVCRGNQLTPWSSSSCLIENTKLTHMNILPAHMMLHLIAVSVWAIGITSTLTTLTSNSL